MQNEFVVELTFVTDQPFTVDNFPKEGVRLKDMNLLNDIGRSVVEGGGYVVVSEIKNFLGHELQETYGWNCYPGEGAAVDIPMTALGLSTALVYVMLESGQVEMAYQDNTYRWRTPAGRAYAGRVIYWKKIPGIIYGEPQKQYEQIADEKQKKEDKA